MLACSFANWSAAADGAQARAWERGISEENRAQALAAFRKGNAHFTEAEYARAAEFYREALRVWDHPRVHGNLATALIHLDERVDAMGHIERALTYGSAPFEPHVHNQLLTNRKLLHSQLSRIEVTCEVAGAQVTVDGKPLFIGPGKRELLVVAGPHAVSAKKPGHLTQSRSLQPLGGQVIRLTLTPVLLADVAKRERRWSAWKPWAVVGTGAAVAFLGIPMGGAAIRARDRFESAQVELCPAGCTPSELAQVTHHQDRARMWNRLEVGAYALGSAALVAGGILVFINRERQIDFNEEGRRVVAVPMLSRESAGVALALGF